MIHSSQVVNRVIDLLKLSGVTNNDTIEEMTDHYLSQIENMVVSGISKQSAIRQTYQTIANTDLSPLNKKQSKKRYWFAAALILLITVLLIQTQQKKVVDIAIVNNNTTIEDTQPTGWPLEGNINEVSSGYGSRIHPIQKTRSFHKGIDIRAKIGTNVIATGNGKVVKSEYSSGYGYFVVIKHNDLYSTKYTHLLDYSVEVGQVVKAGQIIGQVGNSGKSTAPHLHYEVIKDKQVVDPMMVIAP